MIQQITPKLIGYNQTITNEQTPKTSFLGASTPIQQDSFVSAKQNQGEKPASKYTTEIASLLTAGVSLSLLAKSKIKLNKVKSVISETLSTAGEKVQKDVINGAKKLGEIATKDALSGIHNRRSFDAALNKTFGESVQNGSKMHLAMMDMDYFKSVNDVLGHDVGDKFIQRLGHNIKTVGEKHGLNGYRYGGEEFAVVLNGHDAESSKKIISEIADSIKKDPVIQGHKEEFLSTAKSKLAKLHEEQKVLEMDPAYNSNHIHGKNREISALNAWISHVEQNGFTISAGIGDLEKTSKSKPEELLKLADTVLEHSKQSGRNKVSIS